MPDNKDVTVAEKGLPRILMPERQQVELRDFPLDRAIPADHPVAGGVGICRWAGPGVLYRGIRSLVLLC
jgi:hypothetical protein